MDSVKIILKVGNKTRTKFNNSEVHRVITSHEMALTASKLDGCHIVVIERIKHEELDETRDFIKEYTKKEENKVIFYIDDVEEQETSGLADELEYEEFTTLETLHSEIERITGVCVSTSFDKITGNKELDKDLENQFTVFGKDTKEKTEETRNKSDNREEDTTGVESEDHNEGVEQEVEEVNGTESNNSSTVSEQVSIEQDTVTNVSESCIDSGRVEELEKLVRSIKDEKQYLENKLTDIMNDKDVREVIAEGERCRELEKLHEDDVKELESKVEQYNELLQSKEEIAEKLSEANKNIEELSVKLDNALAEAESLKDELEIAKQSTNEAVSIEAELEESRKRVLELEEQLESAINERTELNSIISDKENELEMLRKELGEANDSIAELNSEVSRITDEYSDTKSALDKQIAEREDVESRLNAEIEEARYEIEKYKEELSEADNKVSEAVEQLKKEHQEDMVSMQEKADAYDSLSELNSSLSKINVELKSEVDTLKKENEKTKKAYIKVESEISKIREENEQLKVNIGAVSGIKSADSIEVTPIEYSNKAKIVAVFGHGSFGTTTTAVSIAAKLGGSSKVVFVDLDISTPSIDQWVAKLPYSEDRTLDLPKQYRTGIGVLMKKGYNGFMQYSGMVKCWTETKIGKVDYINGVYGAVTDAEIAVAEYSKMLDYLGSQYDYIVIDCGELYQSSVKDSLIREITKIATSSIYVINGATPLKINSAVTKLNKAEIDKGRVYAFVNMCTNSGINETAKKVLKGIKYSTMQIEISLVGECKPNFCNSPLTKDRFEELVRQAIN